MKFNLVNFRYFVEYLLFRFIIIIINLLPIKYVPIFGAKIFRFFGKFSKTHSTAMNNCKIVFPNLSNNEVQNIIINSWENLGKTVFELTILRKFFTTKNLIEAEGLKDIQDIVEKKLPAIYFSIHHSNWEICPPFLDKMGVNIGVIYRHINNNYIDNFIYKQRSKSFKNTNSFYTPKGKKSAKDILETVKKNNSVFLLIDQKDSAGDDVLFFNQKIKTQTGFLKIARKYNLPLIPIENKRLKEGNFKLKFHRPIYHNQINITDIDMMHTIHGKIEKWIISNPSQWLWQHNRFS